MKLIFTSYAGALDFTDPHQWLKRISGYTGILESLSKNNEVTSIEHINHEGELVQNGVRYYFYRQQRNQDYFPFRMHRLISKLKPDAVFINGFIFPLQILQLRLSLGKGPKIIILHRADRPLKGIKKMLQKMADTCVQAYLFASADFGRQWIGEGIIKSEKKIHEVMHGSSPFRPQNRTLARSVLAIDGAPVFLWVGRLDSNKDPLTVVKAFLRFLQYQPAARLYMVYHTEELLLHIKKLIAAHPSAIGSIILVGKVAQEQLQIWYSAADFIISGSYYEGGGIAICEAMSCACIPIVTDIPSFRKMTADGAYGFLYNAGNADQLFNLLYNTIEINIEEMRTKVLARFQDEFSFSAIGEKINTILSIS